MGVRLVAADFEILDKVIRTFLFLSVFECVDEFLVLIDLLRVGTSVLELLMLSNDLFYLPIHMLFTIGRRLGKKFRLCSLNC